MKGQVFTVAKLHYINGVVYQAADESTTSLQVLAKHSATTTKSGDVQHPVVRVRTLARFAEGLGLVTFDGTTVGITELGMKYSAARAPAKWSLSHGQMALLREHILSQPSQTPTIHAISSLLHLLEQGHAGHELERAYAKAIGKESAWRSDVTFQGFTRFGLSYLEELGLTQGYAHSPTSNFGQSADNLGETADAKKRNPKWSRDELILAVDLYLRHRNSPPSKDSAEVDELSAFLNHMGEVLGAITTDEYRNANGVYMKMMNFRRFDPDYTDQGKVGLRRGNKDEEVVWKEYATSSKRLSEVVHAIRTAVEFHTDDRELEGADEPDIQEAEEGRVLTRLHRIRERNRALILAKKKDVLKKLHRLCCEACGFDFETKYGPVAEGIIDVHHTKPLHTLSEGTTTKLEDLALLCANCHRVVHSSKKWLSVEHVRELTMQR
jgi:predicted HNH restriction endonuclease